MTSASSANSIVWQLAAAPNSVDEFGERVTVISGHDNCIRLMPRGHRENYTDFKPRCFG
jgi:hypothetical protein